MSNTLEQPAAREDVIRAMRELAARGTTVRQLVHEILARLGHKDDAVVPVLWYFTQAFGLSLNEVLPIREWMGTDQDDAINALILPAIENARSKWVPLLGQGPNGMATEASKDPGLLATD